MPQQEIDFRGTGLDTDSDIRVMAPGDSDYRLNSIYDTSNDNSLGNVQNDWGMRQETYKAPPGNNQTIGTCKDPKNNAIIRFNWNSLGLHQIIRWYSITNVTELILQSSFLNFQKNFKITHANVVGDSLSWVDNYVNPINQFDYNGPREISISMAIKYTNGIPGGYTSIDLQTISAIKYPPTKSPVCHYNSVPGQQSQFIGKYPQFFYRYVYFNNAKSVFSPISPILISQNEDANGNFTYGVDNQVSITLLTGHNTVTKLEVGMQVGTAYYIIQVIDKSTIPALPTYNFLYNGDRIEYALDPAEVLKPQDYIPQVGGAQEVVLNNVLVYGNFIEGYENATTDLTATIKLKKATNYAPAFASLNYGNNIKYRSLAFKRTGIYRTGVIYMDEQGRCAPVNSPQTAQVQIPWWRLPTTDPLYVTNFNPSDEWINSMNQKPYIEWNLNGTPPEWAFSYIIVCTKDIRDLEKTITFVQWGAALGDNDGIFQNKKTSLLIPSTAGYSFEQGDRIRLISEYVNWQQLPNGYGALGLAAPVNASTSGFADGVYLQRDSDTYGILGGPVYDFQIEKFDVENSRVQISGEVTGLRPECAYIWEIYNPTRTTTSSEIFYGVGQEYDIINPTLPSRTHSVTTGIIEGIDVYHRWKKIVWRPQRVKFKADQVGTPLTPPVDPNNCEMILNVGNLTTTTFKKSVDIVPSPVPLSVGATKTSAVVKDFRDNTFGTTVNGTWPTFNMFYEPASPIGAGAPPSTFSVIDSTIINVQSGAMLTQNVQTILLSLLSSATVSVLGSPNGAYMAGINVLLTEGGKTTIEFDTWNNPDLNTNNKDFLNPEFEVFILCEDHSISDFYPSNYDSTGKGYVEDPLAVRKRYPANLRHGGRLFQETQINNLFSFNSSDYTFVQERYNEITRLRNVGFMLIIRQQSKNNAMYIGRVEYQQASGGVDVVATDKIFGTINPSEEFYGSTTPAADIKSNRNTYFYDTTNGQVLRDSSNGMVAISGNKESDQDPYKMKKFFYDYAAKIRKGGFEVIGNWDEYIECYVLTIRDQRRRIDGEKDESVTLVFHEPTNRWKSFMSYIPEWYENIGNITVSFKDGILWQHYADSDNRGTYYGVPYNQEFAVICNIGYNTKKVFTNIDLDSNVSWDCEISIPPNSTYPVGMKSRIKAAKFVSREGKFSADFAKDMLTPGQPSQELALVNGRELRGEAMRVLLINNERKFVYLRQAIIYITASELN